MESWLAISPWPGVSLWSILYSSGYYLTRYSARGFREIGHFQFEGNFELTPQYQEDINALKPVSRLHITLLILSGLLIVFVWWLTRYFSYLQGVYLLYLGMYMLVAALTFSLFFPGGAIMCTGMGFKHSRMAKKAKLSSAQIVPTQL